MFPLLDNPIISKKKILLQPYDKLIYCQLNNEIYCGQIQNRFQHIFGMAGNRLAKGFKFTDGDKQNKPNSSFNLIFENCV